MQPTLAVLGWLPNPQSYSRPLLPTMEAGWEGSMDMVVFEVVCGLWFRHPGLEAYDKSLRCSELGTDWVSKEREPWSLLSLL